jgi:hypothetical protein
MLRNQLSIKTMLGRDVYFATLTRCCLPGSHHFLQSAIPCVVRQNNFHIWAVCLSRTLVIFRLNIVRRLSESLSVLQAAISKDIIQKMTRKLETKGTLQTRQGGHRHAVTDNTAPNVRRRILASPAKSLRRLSKETGMCYSSRQSEAGKGRIHRHHVVQEIQPPGT